jgi:hemoglobin-like flavoprotein
MSLNIELLESSFSRLEEDSFANYFYNNLFADYPELKPLFANTLMEEQSKKLFKSLALVIENLQKPDILTEVLQKLGTRHVNYQVLPEHYPMVGKTLLKTFAMCLDDEWTSDLEQAWVDAYTAVAKLMSSDVY